MTTYQSLLTGPKREPGDQGPEELHVVLLDNGRSRMLEQDITRQSLACIRCGACLNVCPVYQQVGGHAYGSVYPGPIGAVVTPQLVPLATAAQLPFASTLCGACRDVCPVAIDIPALLLHLRQQVREGSAKERAAAPRWFERFAMRLWRSGCADRAAIALRWPSRAAAIAGSVGCCGSCRRCGQWSKGRTARGSPRATSARCGGNGQNMTTARDSILASVRTCLRRASDSPVPAPPPVPLLGRVDLDAEARSRSSVNGWPRSVGTCTSPSRTVGSRSCSSCSRTTRRVPSRAATRAS
jgi:ferredoxin